jgi:hypothetical protein
MSKANHKEQAKIKTSLLVASSLFQISLPARPTSPTKKALLVGVEKLSSLDQCIPYRSIYETLAYECTFPRFTNDFFVGQTPKPLVCP